MKIKAARETVSPGMERQAIGGPPTAEGGQPFDTQFELAGRKIHEQTLAQLANRIDEQGRVLAKKADISEMERYRALISELLNEVVNNAYSFHKENSFDSRGRRKVYSIVRRVNEKLEELAQEIICGSRDALRIIGKIDDIRGLIIDILL